MSSKVTISVVVPTHNRAYSLKRCLESLRHQTFPLESYEVIVVDDASEDETPELVRKLRLPETFRYIRQPHGGPSAARNRGAKLARGELLLFFDDDVVATPRLLEAHLDAHHRWVDSAVLGYTPFAGDLLKTPIMEYHRARWDRIFADVTEAQALGQIPFNYFITLNLSVRRDAFLLIGPFDTTLGIVYEDTELGLRFEQAGVPLRFCREAMALHRPSLDEWSLTERQEKFGYRAGLYYLRHPDQRSMIECINVPYVLGIPASRGMLRRLRTALRGILLTDFTASLLLLAITQAGGLMPAGKRNYLCALIKWHYYGRGFKQALKEAKHRSGVS